ncbi:FAD-binding domain-containing protein [Myxosarcina sp. GI1]|uniref:FAD-binding domain-containing protein n=1 Tax=Myxosarcina sp. GI1 TaxID=1541065 RepID=UPI00055C2504|nr:FAD-binding domain-containing protein [Myxosarcina sp. GI1]
MQIIWFRRDLRLSDNEIVAEACKNQQEVLPCFIIDPWFYQQPETGKARVRFLFESLTNLDVNLRKLGSKLYFFEGESVAIIRAITRSLLALGKQPKLYFNQDVQVQYGIDRDLQILDFYRQHNLETHIGKNHFLQNEECYETYWQNYHDYQERSLHPRPKKINTPQLTLGQIEWDELQQKYCHYWEAQKLHYFVGSENEADKTLRDFLGYRYRGYHWRMSRPWLAQRGASSHLSPHLVFGTISTRTVYQEASKLLQKLLPKSKNAFALSAFLDRLRWHDKFTQRLYFHPQLVVQNRYSEFDDWYSPEELGVEKQKLFLAWCKGQTGFPLVDASMRQLNRMGWMNFRMRSMCATFLTINCGVSWHHGARYFMSRLVDGDIAINHWQWQMQSGITNPMSKTFRIYNPTKNLQEKDPELQFVRHWLPELRGHSMEQLLTRKYNNSYPQPILDWKQTRLTNGKVVSQIRAKVRERLEKEGGEEYESALGAKKTVEKYFTTKDRQYRNLK